MDNAADRETMKTDLGAAGQARRAVNRRVGYVRGAEPPSEKDDSKEAFLFRLRLD